jgi:GNAT superfamily N-acetyltransferase
VRIRPVRPDDWPAIVELFGDRGACGGCWCMYWRLPRGGKLWEEVKGRKNRDRFRRLVKAGKVHAVMAFAGERPVGWCCFGPRSTFPRLETVRALRRDWSETTWSIVCFYLPSRWRGAGMGTRLLAAAAREAFARGAREIEGYPVVPKRGRIPAAFAWTGVPAMFERAGMTKLRRRGASRPIYVRCA